MVSLELHWPDPTWIWRLYGPCKTMPIIKLCATRLSSIVPVVAVVTLVIEYCKGRILVLYTMYMANHPQVDRTIQEGWSYAC